MGPLAGVRVVEVAAIGPVPFAGMVLADLGADVVRVDRASVARGEEVPVFNHPDSVYNRGRRSVGIDLKHPDGVEAALRLIERSDVLLEGFRPGVTERLGIGPDECLARNPRLVYGRMTGYGQDGPMSQAAGHDIDYIALGGALGRIGRFGQPPTPPLNLLGDYAGGSFLLVMGVVSALWHVARGGEGQVIDAAMIDGVALLMTPFFGPKFRAAPPPRGTELVDSGAPFYDAYETADGRWMAVGAMEPQFYANFLRVLELDGEELPAQMDASGWPRLRERFTEVFRTRTRDEWCARTEGIDACLSPVLELSELERHPHHAARGSFPEVGGIVQPLPAPRFSATPADIPPPPPSPGAHTDEVLREVGLSGDELAKLRNVGAIA